MTTCSLPTEPSFWRNGPVWYPIKSGTCPAFRQSWNCPEASDDEQRHRLSLCFNETDMTPNFTSSLKETNITKRKLICVHSPPALGHLVLKGHRLYNQTADSVHVTAPVECLTADTFFFPKNTFSTQAFSVYVWIGTNRCFTNTSDITQVLIRRNGLWVDSNLHTELC